MTSAANDATLVRFGRKAADIAMRAMLNRLTALGVTDDEIRANTPNLCGACRATVKAALPGALDAAKEAADAGRAPETVFYALMAQAGIEAANEEQAWVE